MTILQDFIDFCMGRHCSCLHHCLMNAGCRKNVATGGILYQEMVTDLGYYSHTMYHHLMVPLKFNKPDGSSLEWTFTQTSDR